MRVGCNIKFIGGEYANKRYYNEYECPPIIGDIVAVKYDDIDKPVYGKVEYRIFETYNYIILIVSEVKSPL